MKSSGVRQLGFIMIATALFMYMLLYAPTPYVVYEPGLAAPTKPMVRMGEGADEVRVKPSASPAPASKPEEGAFLMTAVRLSDANWWETLSSAWDNDIATYSRSSILRGYTEQEYAERMTVVMQGSQNQAIEAAYRFAHLPYQSVVDSIAVSDVLQGSDDSGWQPGDALVSLKGGKPFADAEQIVSELSAHKPGDKVVFTVKRAGAEQDIAITMGAYEAPLTLNTLPAALGGVKLAELRSLQPDDARFKLRIDAGAIGGPSAGLMFALQSLDLLLGEQDLTGGAIIAGTGTIAADGTVGEIGGIAFKVIAASREGAELFLAPSANYKEAADKAKDIGTSMKIVSVNSLSEAKQVIEQHVSGN
ncbi:S16 family serine protease [Paenibacillus sp. KS-LC4]|uniref:YlbL family protein n=1 Tax=Paenibacillus sp. KS-LC4 TaxID=2979727 RepID=UPI0030CECB70